MAKPVYRSKGPHQYHRLTALLQRGIHIALSPTFGPILPQRVLCFRSLLAKLETPRILNDKFYSVFPLLPVFLCLPFTESSFPYPGSSCSDQSFREVP